MLPAGSHGYGRPGRSPSPLRPIPTPPFAGFDKLFQHPGMGMYYWQVVLKIASGVLAHHENRILAVSRRYIMLLNMRGTVSRLARVEDVSLIATRAEKGAVVRTVVRFHPHLHEPSWNLKCPEAAARSRRDFVGVLTQVRGAMGIAPPEEVVLLPDEVIDPVRYGPFKKDKNYLPPQKKRLGLGYAAPPTARRTSSPTGPTPAGAGGAATPPPPPQAHAAHVRKGTHADGGGRPPIRDGSLPPRSPSAGVARAAAPQPPPPEPAAAAAKAPPPACTPPSCGVAGLHTGEEVAFEGIHGLVRDAADPARVLVAFPTPLGLRAIPAAALSPAATGLTPRDVCKEVTIRAAHPSDALGLSYSGLLVTHVAPGGLGDTAGVEAGRRLAAVDGIPVRTVNDAVTASLRVASTTYRLLFSEVLNAGAGGRRRQGSDVENLEEALAVTRDVLLQVQGELDSTRAERDAALRKARGLRAALVSREGGAPSGEASRLIAIHLPTDGYASDGAAPASVAAPTDSRPPAADLPSATGGLEVFVTSPGSATSRGAGAAASSEVGCTSEARSGATTVSVTYM